jgi:hypothetical protein
MKFIDETSGRSGKVMTPRNREAMFARFLEWRDKQQATAPGAPTAATASPDGPAH